MNYCLVGTVLSKIYEGAGMILIKFPLLLEAKIK